jgi:nucleoside 2-deoxyribosyltransferase
MNIYLAHPINGLSGMEIFAYYEDASEQLREHYTILHPMLGKGYLRTEAELRSHGYDFPASTNKAIFGRDMWMVRMADIVLVDLAGAKAASLGCAIELAMAHALGKHTVLVLDQEDKIHNHAFILECADVVFGERNSAIQYLVEMAPLSKPLPK